MIISHVYRWVDVLTVVRWSVSWRKSLNIPFCIFDSFRSYRYVFELESSFDQTVKRKLNQVWSTILPILTKQTTNSYLTEHKEQMMGMSFISFCLSVLKTHPLTFPVVLFLKLDNNAPTIFVPVQTKMCQLSGPLIHCCNIFIIKISVLKLCIITV